MSCVFEKRQIPGVDELHWPKATVGEGGVVMFFSGVFVQWLGVTRASAPRPAPPPPCFFAILCFCAVSFCGILMLNGMVSYSAPTKMA